MIYVLPNPPKEVALSDDILKEIYEDNEADYFISAQKECII